MNRRAGNADAIKKALDDMYKVKTTQEELIEKPIKETKPINVEKFRFSDYIVDKEEIQKIEPEKKKIGRPKKKKKKTK